MKEEIVFAGFGGQGVLLMGKLLCVAAMEEGKYVSHIPSYGAEMRGGTANCQVVISDEEVASPIVAHPSIAVVLNTPSFAKFEPKLKNGGLLLYNSSLVDLRSERTDITVVDVAANNIAEDAGSGRAANMAAIGKLLKLKPGLCSLEGVIQALEKVVSARNKKLNEVNEKVLKAGFAA
ncbi:2-oxoacid:acceptor oxidoreductase family protein [Sediminispirochaeta bajacaliforniensis]|uniref:2-oxoacid:acceptor oxidoreductase family protein n=1 Tax=Sediminispirochaeta bajacaliforniensis TaxID=148 RepID=UPI0003733ABF|nr:2-oxoacid:acceptor oxidoreductase family protein [Sediminispirochaeta bajacaliforniensis]